MHIHRLQWSIERFEKIEKERRKRELSVSTVDNSRTVLSDKIGRANEKKRKQKRGILIKSEVSIMEEKKL